MVFEPITVFLSYARADDDPNYDDVEKSFMRRLYTALTAEGFDVWWDREKLPARSLTFTDEIEIAIRACDRFVLIAGPGANASDYVTAEWTFAMAQCKAITPALRVGDYAVIPPEIAGINAIDCRPTRDETAAFKDIINRLREDAPLGKKIGGKGLPRGYVNRPAPFKAARDALMADAIQTAVTVISAPQREPKPGRDAEPQQAVAVYGLGGIGKSTLAAALTDDCDIRRHFRDGVIWLEVGQTPIVASLQAWIGVHFGDNRDNYQNEDDGTRSLSLVLHDKAALLVLDDVWDHKIVERFPVGGTACRLLITTRSGALASRVEGSDVRLDLLSPDEGAAIITGRTNATDPLYLKISETLGGHTLAVTLAALQIAEGYADDAADLLRLLEKRAQSGEPFRDLAVDADDKDLNLALSLSLSYDALKDDDLRRRFRATGIFALEGSFDRAALAAVWGDADEDDARGALRALVGAGLLDEVESPHPPAPSPNLRWPSAAGRGGVRYSQHRLLRAYARALLAEVGELDAVFERYADFYIAHAYTIFDDLPPEQWSHYDADLPDITALGDALLERTENGTSGDLARSMEFAYSATNYIGFRRDVQKWVWLEMGLNAVRTLRAIWHEDETLISREPLFLSDLGLAMTVLGDYQKALNLYTQALMLYRAIESRGGEATVLGNIGRVWDVWGEKRKALDYYHESLQIFQELGDRGREGISLNNIGLTWAALGEYRKALNCYEQALRLRRTAGDHSGEAITLNNIGLSWAALGEHQKALDYYEQALRLRQTVGNISDSASTLSNIGLTWATLGEYHKALHYYHQSLPLRQAIGDRGGEAITLSNIGGAWDTLGEKQKALDYYEQALHIFQTIGDRNGEASTLSNIGLTWAALGEHRKALDYYEQALRLRKAVEDRSGEANTLNSIGATWLALGDAYKALDYYQQALSLRLVVEDRDGEANTLNNIGATWLTLGDTAKALDYYQQALPLRKAVGDRLGEATTLNNMAAIYYYEGDFEKAADTFHQIITIFHAIGAVAEEATILFNLAVVYQHVGRIDEAIQSTEASLEILIRYNLPQDAAGQTVAHRDTFLAQLRGESSPQEDPQATFVRQIVALYQQGGAEAVRSALAEAGAPEEVINDWLAQLAAQFGD